MKRPTPYGLLVVALALAPALLVLAVAIPAFAAGYMACYGSGQLFEEDKK